MYNNNLSTQTYLPTKVVSCSQTPFDIFEIDSLPTPFHDDSFFSSKNNNDFVPLPSVPEVVMNELDPQPFQSSVTKEFLGSIELNDFEIGCFTEVCAIDELEMPNSHIENLEENTLSMTDSEIRNKKLRRQNLQLRTRIDKLKYRLQTVQRSKRKIVRITKRFVASVTNFTVGDSVCHDSSEAMKMVKKKAQTLKKNEVTMNSEIKKNKITSPSSSKNRKNKHIVEKD